MEFLRLNIEMNEANGQKWVEREMCHRIDSNETLNAGEKGIMKMWNIFLMRNP